MTDNILRQSQLITTYGPGAMVDLPDTSVIVSGLRDWTFLGSERVDEPRLVAKLRTLLTVPALYLRTPPRHDENSDKKALVGARIFPTWFLVKQARRSPANPHWLRRRLVPWDQLDRGKFLDEDHKRKPVVPVRFVCGCRRGHVDDLDWRRFVHRGATSCRRRLWIEERGTGADISDTHGVCECGVERSLYEASQPGNEALGQCAGKRPWIGQFATEPCNETYRLLVRTASNAYFSQTMGVISLPETDGDIAGTVTRHFERLKDADDLGVLANFRKIPELHTAFADFADESVLEEYARQKGGGEPDEVPVKTAEFRVLDDGAAAIGEDDPRSRFHAETALREEWDNGGDARLAKIDKLVLVHRLREVVALLGFTRFEAFSPDQNGELDINVIRASLDESVTWLPAVENRGEGLFLSFREDAVREWLKRPGVQNRGTQILAGWKIWASKFHRPEKDFPDLPYVMLHSLSHMLITSITLDCGYPASALRERVYAREGNYGILIYTGSSDSEGTLGGLVETGRRISDHLRRALDRARMCSNDPVCAERAPDSRLEGRMLQGAACHGCLLIAETSCEQRNYFLDRALVVPTVADGDAAFFDSRDN